MITLFVRSVGVKKKSKGGKENCFTSLSRLRSYRDKIDTRNRQEISFLFTNSSTGSFSRRSTTDSPPHRRTRVYSDQAKRLCVSTSARYDLSSRKQSEKPIPFFLPSIRPFFLLHLTLPLTVRQLSPLLACQSGLRHVITLPLV